MYREGLGVDQDYTQAVKWFQKSAEQGNASAQSALGDLYYDGHGVIQDHGQALKWFQEAAKQDDAYAQYSLGFMYGHGIGVGQDYGQALTWYRKAADQGEALAQSGLADLYYDGHGITKDYDQAMRWYTQAAKQDHVDAQYALGLMYLNGPRQLIDYEKALHWLLKAAGQDHPSAQNSLGVMYANGLGVTQDLHQAASWYLKSAERGEQFAQYNLGRAYLYGEGVLPEHTKALKWLSKSAEQDNEEALKAVKHIEALEEEFKRRGITDAAKHERVAKLLLSIPREVADTPDMWVWIVRGKRPTKKDANKFLLACIIDYQMAAERVWKTARQFTEEQLGDPENLWEYITSFTEQEWQAKKKEFSLHWLLAAHMRVWHIGRDVPSQYEGDARRIWEGQPPGGVHERLQKLGKSGIGVNISNMLIGALIDTEQIVGTGDVKADTHVRRVSGRVFYGKEFKAEDSSKAVEEARKMYPHNPWQLDQPLYFLGGATCKKTGPDCASCFLRLECFYIEENRRYASTVPTCKGE